MIGSDESDGFIAKLPERSLLFWESLAAPCFRGFSFGPGGPSQAKPAGCSDGPFLASPVLSQNSEPVFFGPCMHAGDSLRLHQHCPDAVVDYGVLLGVVRR